MKQKYKPQKMKILIKASLTEDEYGLLCEALRSYAEINYEAGFVLNTTDIERFVRTHHRPQINWSQIKK